MSGTGYMVGTAYIRGLDLSECDGIYPRTRDGQCQGCGTTTANEEEHRRVHRRIKEDPPNFATMKIARRTPTEG